MIIKMLQMISLAMVIFFLPLSVTADVENLDRALHGKQFNIIIFHNFHAENRAVSEFRQSVADVIQRKHNIKIFHEYLDTALHQEAEYPKYLASTLEVKHRELSSIDLIICPDDASLNFMLNEGKNWAPKAQLLACNITTDPESLKKSSRNVVIIRHPCAIADTAVEAARIYPEANKLLLLEDRNLNQPDVFKSEIQLQMEGLRSIFQVETLNISGPNAKDELKSKLDDKTIAIFVSFFPFPNFHIKNTAHDLNALFSGLPKPVFVIQQTLLPGGVVGGKVPDLRATGILVGETALYMLAGKQVRSMAGPSIFVFDSKVMKKFKIKTSMLPAGSIILNQPPGRNIIDWLPWLGLTFVIESLLILCLFMLYRKSHHAGEELQASTRQWRSLTENLPDIIFRLDRDGEILYINHNVEQIMNIKVEDIIGKTARSSEHPIADEYRNEVLSIFEHGRPMTKEVTLETCRGPLVLESRLIPEHDSSGNIVSVLGISRDVTKRKTATRELTIHQFIVASTKLPIILLKPNGRINYANTAATEMFGGDAGGIKGRSVDNMSLVFNQYNNIDALLKAVISKRHLSLEAEFIPDQRPKRTLTLIFNCLQLENEEFICLFVQDITSQKHAQEELTAAKERAEKSDRLKSSFLANVSHEIRTPLNGILGFAELLKYADNDDPDRKKYIDIIYESGNTLLQIIEDILDISKIESGQIKVNLTDFNLTKLLNEVYQLFQHKIVTASGKIQLHLRLPSFAEDEAGIPVRTDEIRLRQILNNLISNAIKFTPEGAVEIGCRVSGEYLELYVRDTGIGIPKEKQKLIFEPFRQADDTISRTYGGTGLGLAIAASYAKLLNGHITLESEPGRGSTFSLVIPRGSDIAIPIDHGDRKLHNCKWPDRKVLVAEDDYTSFLFINKIITDTGAQVIHVESGKEAIRQCIADRSINAVLMDVRLPDVDGWEATSKIKATRPHLPIIIETANALSQDREKSAACGSDAFLTKPIRKEDLLATLAKFFD